MPDQVNPQIQDGILTHTVNLLRLSGQERTQVLAMLEELEGKLLVCIQAAAGKTPLQAAKLQALLQQTQSTINKAYDAISAANVDTLEKVAQLEATKVANVVNGAIGVAAQSVAMSPEQLAALAGKALIQGEQPAKWWASQAADLQFKFAAQMRMGIAQGESVDSLVQRVRGTKSKGYTDGLMAVSKARAEALVRTSVMTVANQARLAAIMSNPKLIKGVQWVATLDSRTTPICRALDGLQWTIPDLKPVGHDKEWPGVIAHWNCRSTQTPVTRSWEELANKPLPTPQGEKTLDELLREKLKASGMSEQNAAAVTAETRASMDGQVAKTLTFDEWLKTKDKAFQDSLLGPQRAALWREGKVTIPEMTDQKNNPLTIHELHALVAKNEAIAPAKEGDGGLTLAERKILEQSLAEGIKTQISVTTFMDMDTGERVTTTGTPTADEIAKIQQLGKLGMYQNAVAAGDAFTPVQIKQMAVLHVQKAVVVQPDGSTVAFHGPIQPADAEDIVKKQLTSRKAPIEALKAGWKGTLLDVEEHPAGTVVPPPKTYNETFPPLLEKPAPFFDAKAKEQERAAAQKATQDAAQAKLDEMSAKGGSHAAAVAEAVAQNPGATPQDILEKADQLHEIANTKAAAEIQATIAEPKGKLLTAKHIAKLQAFSPELTPADLLAKAKANASIDQAKGTQAAALSGYKKKYLADQEPTPAQKKALAALPELDQEAFLNSLATQKAKLLEIKLAEEAAAAAAAAEAKLHADAQKTIGETLANPAGKTLLAKNLAKLMQTQPDLKPAHLLSAAQEAALKDQAKASQSAALSGYKKKVLEGKQPTPAQVKALSQADAAQPGFAADFLNALEAQKQATATQQAAKAATQAAKDLVTAESAPMVPTEPPTAPVKPGAAFPDAPTGKVVQSLGGSTGAQLIESPQTGLLYVRKSGSSPAHLREEYATDASYRALGVATPDSRLYDTPQGPVKLSAYIEGSQTLGAYLSTATPEQRTAILNQIRGGFVADALLANWDVVGLSRDNILVKDGIAYRIDNGGALRFRAMGALKTGEGAFGPKVLELKTLLDPAKNPQTAEIFKGISDAEIASQAKAILSKREELLSVTPEELRSTMEARLEDLAKQTGVAFDQPPAPEVPPVPETPAVSKETLKAIKAAKVNGFPILGDRDWIEDMSQLIWQESDVSGAPVTRVQFKLTKAGSDAVLEVMGDQAKTAVATAAVNPAQHPLDSFYEPIKAAAKTVSVHATDGNYNLQTIKTFEAAKENLATLKAANADPDVQKMVAFYESAAAAVDQAKASAKALPVGSLTQFKWEPITATAAKPESSLPSYVKVARTDLSYVEKKLTEASAKELTSLAFTVSQGNSVAFSLDFGDATVRFIPTNGGVQQTQALALHGNVEIRAKGAVSPETVARVNEIIRLLGIDNTPPSKEYLELAYLRRNIALIKKGSDPQFETIFFGDGTDAEKLAKARDYFEKTYKIKLPDKWGSNYNPEGSINSQGNGWRNWQRLDYPRDEIEKAMAGYALRHTSGADYGALIDAILKSGGEFTPTTARLRKGISLSTTGGKSPEADITTGGANYFFTRLRASTDKSAGIFFKIGTMSRADTVTYDDDYFGRISFLAKRINDPAQWKQIAAAQGWDETSFKNGLNLLDDVDFIRARDAGERGRILQAFLDAGITRLTDGRLVQDIVIL